MQPFLTGVIVAAASVISTSVSAQTSEHERAQLVNARQGLMFDLQDRYLILMSVSDSKSADFAGAAEAAREMITIMTEFVTFLAPGTARGEAPGSRARPEVWTDAPGFAASVDGFRAEAMRLAEVADTADAVAFADAFRDFEPECTACHELRPSRGGRYRFAMDE